MANNLNQTHKYMYLFKSHVMIYVKIAGTECGVDRMKVQLRNSCTAAATGTIKIRSFYVYLPLSVKV